MTNILGITKKARKEETVTDKRIQHGTKHTDELRTDKCFKNTY